MRFSFSQATCGVSPQFATYCMRARLYHVVTSVEMQLCGDLQNRAVTPESGWHKRRIQGQWIRFVLLLACSVAPFTVLSCVI